MIALAEQKLSIGDIAVIVVGIALIVGMGTLLIIKLIKAVKSLKADKAKGEKEPVLVSADEVGEAMDVKGDYLVMARNVIYTVGADAQILSGKYVFKNAVSGLDAFNLRYNGLVREYADNTEMVLANGDTVCAVSNAVLIKSVEA